VCSCDELSVDARDTTTDRRAVEEAADILGSGTEELIAEDLF
jgi:hypothetical protein